MNKKFYNETFYQEQIDGSLRSAREVVAVILSLVQPQTVVDVGCGMGAWLSVFKENGIDEAVGLDGDYVDKDKLLIPQNDFIACDLTKNINLSKTFDLVVSLEVAEHLPVASAKNFVKNLTSLGKTVVFSAAVPGQGGVNHINEQWAEFWRDLFAARGYEAIDCLRPRIWNNQKVEVCYRQNVLLYVESNFLQQFPVLLKEREKWKDAAFSLVHPELLQQIVQQRPTLRTIITSFPGAVAETIKQRAGKIRN